MLSFARFFISWILLWILLVQVGGLSYASPNTFGNPSEWQEAKGLYEADRLQDALELLQAHPPHLNSDHAPVAFSSYYYNLGTIYYRLNHLGSSLAYLEKAHRIQPWDSDIAQNLLRVKASLTRSLGSEQLDPASSELEQWGDNLSEDLVRIIFGVSGLLSGLLWTWIYRKKRALKSTLQHPLSLLSITLLISGTGLLSVQKWSSSLPPAICLEKQVVRSGPGDHYMELTRIPEGTKVRVLGPSASSPLSQADEDPKKPDKSASQPQNEVWNQIRYSPEGVGWVKVSGLFVL